MPDDDRRPIETSRLSFQPDRYDTVLLDGRPLAELYGESDDDNCDQPYLSLDPHDPSYEIPVLEQLKDFDGWTPISVHSDDYEYDYSKYLLFFERLKVREGWTPIVVSNCNSSLGFNSKVFIVWVEESGDLVTWSRFARNSQGEIGPDGAPSVVFAKKGYLEFIKEAENRAVAAWLIWRLCSRDEEKCDLAGELKKYDSNVASGLLSRLVFDAAHGRWLAGQISSALSKRSWTEIVMGLPSHPASHILFAGFLIGVRFYVADQLEWWLDAAVCLIAALYGLAGIRGLSRKLHPRNYEAWEPQVFMTSDGFRVGWDRELIPWDALSGCDPGPVEVAEDEVPSTDVIKVEAGGRVDFKLKILDGPKKFSPDLSALNKHLSTLIKAHKL